MTPGARTRVGTLRHRVDIYAQTLVRDAHGGQTETYTKVASGVWASLSVQGRVANGEDLSSGQIQSELTHIIRMRYRADINPRSRIVYNGRDFDVDRIINLEERNRYLDVFCIERPK